MSQLLSAGEMARALGVHPSTVYRHATSLGGTKIAGRLVFEVGSKTVDGDRLRELVREEVRAEFQRRQSDRPDDPVTGGQVRLVHARRSAAGITQDELKAHIGEHYGCSSLTELSQQHLDDVLEWMTRHCSMTTADL